ncbi:hypothetical protein ACFX2B_029615 [Malus domestica]
MYFGAWPSFSNNSGASAIIVSTDGPSGMAIDIRVALLFTIARCITLLYLHLVSEVDKETIGRAIDREPLSVVFNLEAIHLILDKEGE